LLARNRENQGEETICATTEGKDLEDVKNIPLFVKENSIHCRFDEDQQWLILPDEKRSIMQKMLEKGKPLGEWERIKIRYGVKTGRNDAFVVSTAQRDAILSDCATDEERQRTEALIHPIVEGIDIHRYQYQWSDKWIVGFYPSLHLDIEDYPAVKHHLLFYSKDWLISQGHAAIANDGEKMKEFGKKYLEQCGKPVVVDGSELKDANGQPIKSRKKMSHKWYETSDNIAFHEDFSKIKIAWGNLNKQASCTWISDDMHVNAPAVMITPGTKYLLAALNSRLADFFMQTISVVRNGGYYEYKPQFVKLIPLIENPSAEYVNEIERLADLAMQGDVNAEKEIDCVFEKMYGLTEEEIKLLEE
jgi:hypothetical protein